MLSLPLLHGVLGRKRPFQTGGSALVLVIGEDQFLLRTRERVLAKTQAEVVSFTPTELASNRSVGAVDVVVLCHSLQQQTALGISAGARKRWPGVRILQLAKFEFDRRPLPAHADGIALASNPDELVSKTTELLDRTRP